MKKYIVLSVNDNPKYLFYVPLTVWAWRQFGWEPIIFNSLTQIRNGMFPMVRNMLKDVMLVPFEDRVPGYQAETITQVSRLYAGSLVDFDAYVMTGDIDMIPLSDYWKPSPYYLTVYGRDLTDYHYPICYIGMPAASWRTIMNLTGEDSYNQDIKRDLDSLPQAKGTDKVKRWVTDQDLITERINNSKYVPERIDRGTGKNGYPIGRVDRSAWTLKHDVFIDAHLPHDILTNAESFKKVLELLHHIWPEQDFKWFVNYYREFKKLA